VLREKFNPRNINHMPAVKFFARLDLDQICLFLDAHKAICTPCVPEQARGICDCIPTLVRGNEKFSPVGFGLRLAEKNRMSIIVTL
jgi:hypothetical protein